MSKYSKNSSDAAPVNFESSPESQVRSAERYTGKSLDIPLFDFCVWYVKNKKGPAIKAVSWLAGSRANHTPNVLTIFTETSISADLIRQWIGQELQNWVEQKTIRFEYQTPVHMPVCKDMRISIEKRLGRGTSLAQKCNCYTCEKTAEKSLAEAA